MANRPRTASGFLMNPRRLAEAYPGKDVKMESVIGGGGTAPSQSPCGLPPEALRSWSGTCQVRRGDLLGIRKSTNARHSYATLQTSYLPASGKHSRQPEAHPGNSRAARAAGSRDGLGDRGGFRHKLRSLRAEQSDQSLCAGAQPRNDTACTAAYAPNRAGYRIS